MPKPSQLPLDSAPVTADYVVGNQASGPTTQRFKFSDLITLFWNLANIPAGQTSPITRDSEMQSAFVASGLVWSGDSYGTNRNASMTAGVCYINGRRISLSAVTARTFTASVDTYIDVLDNGDGTGTLVYTTAVNNAASPSLAANSIRIGIIVTGATTIANAGSVNQGQEDKVLPIASSVAYSVTDSLGNLICCRDPQSKLIGYRQISANWAGTASGNPGVQIPGLSAPFIVPTGRKVKARVFSGNPQNNGTSNQLGGSIWDGTVGSGTKVGQSLMFGVTSSSSFEWFLFVETLRTPTSNSKTYNAGFFSIGGGTASITADPTFPTYIMIELE